MEGPPLEPGGEDITWPDQVAPRGRKASSTRKIKPQTSNLHTYYAIITGRKHKTARTMITDIEVYRPCQAAAPRLGPAKTCQ